MNIDINYLLTLSERKLENFSLISHLSTFYKEIFCYFNECKKEIEISNLSNVKFAQQPLWNNILYQFKGKTICFKNWIASNILYTKDLFDENGNFKTLQEISNTLINKSNWLCEYKILKKVVTKQSNMFDMKCCIFTKTTPVNSFNFNSGLNCITDKKCKFFYENMLSKKFKYPCYQSILGRNFCVSKEYWCNIYRNKIKLMYDKRLSEFNYKLLNNILCCNSFLQKCKLRENAKCEFCGNENENIKHLIFDCDNVKGVWQKLNIVMNYDVQWKHIVVGFYLETNSRIRFYNTIISYLAYKIYKFKMKSRIENIIQEKFMLEKSIRYSLEKDINFMLNLSKTCMFKDLVKLLTNLL
ncbi:uncharacterized protein LOC134236030 [Saccostrea cucullata]|uniref:uncharacterized protein LOC134236030 n=1 Tax=Saccostrea cuccullata TaxID=36930 RepID=UPI002ED2D953